VKQIADEYQGLSRYRYRIIGNLFVVLLLKIKDRFWKDYDPLQESDRGSVIVQTFKQNMEKSYRNLANLKTLPNVQDYTLAQQLHPNYFSTAIKNKTGKSVNTWIHEKTLLEAQALLSNKNLSVKEVAYQLKFSEPTHFSKFFKKYTQQTPIRIANRLHLSFAPSMLRNVPLVAVSATLPLSCSQLKTNLNQQNYDKVK